MVAGVKRAVCPYHAYGYTLHRIAQEIHSEG